MDRTLIIVFDVVARVLMAAVFVYSGIGKLADPSVVAVRLTDAGFPLPMLGAYGAILIELAGSALLVIGWQLLPVTAVMAGYTVLATLLIHRFWAFEGAAAVMQTLQFLKNGCILSGLWFIARTSLTTAERAVEASPRPAASR
jgi:putative oxidoreductase